MTDPALTALYKRQSQFETLVLAHVEKYVPHAAWLKFRELAASPDSKKVDRLATGADNLTPRELIIGGSSTGTISVNDFLVAYEGEAAPIIIGHIDDAPIYFWQDKGMYIWSLSGDGPWSLDIWLSYPAYPPHY